MKLSRKQKLAIGIATAWPLVFLLGMFVIISAAVAISSPDAPPLLLVFAENMGAIFVLMLFTMIESWALAAFYRRHAAQNMRLNSETRGRWRFWLLLGNTFVFPSYFARYVLPLKDDPD